jgi:2-methylcitrate dehydratase
MQNNKLAAEEIAEININTFYWVKTQEIYEPAGVVDAQFAIPFTVAMIVLGRKPGPGWYAEENLEDPLIKEISKKVKVKIDPELDRVYVNEGEQTAKVEVITTSGARYSEHIKIPSGDPRNPLSYGEIKDKFVTQASYVLNQETIKRVLELIADFENIKDIKAFMALLVGNQEN